MIKTILSILVLWLLLATWFNLTRLPSVSLAQTNLPVVDTLESIMQDSYRVTEQTRFYEEELRKNYSSGGWIKSNIDRHLIK